MVDVATNFAEMIETRLNSLGQNVFAAEKSAGLPVDAIRSVIRDDGKRAVPKITRAKEICDFLGLEFYIGPPRVSGTVADDASGSLSGFSSTQTLPRQGYAKCGVDGWSKDVEESPPLPRPEGLTDDQAFYVVASGQSMVPEGINGGNICLISPAKPLEDGDRVWIEDTQGKAAIKRLIKQTAKSYMLRGWMPKADGQQQSFDEKRFKDGIKHIYPVIAVYNKTPGAEGAKIIADPNAAEYRGGSAGQDNTIFDKIILHDVQASAGAGQMAREGKVVSALAFPRPWLSRMGINPQRASLIYIDGDSMEPTLQNGSIALINHNRTRLTGRRVYALRQGDDLFVKRLEKLADDQLLIHSDNTAHQTRLVSGYDLEQTVILGEVVWSAASIST